MGLFYDIISKQGHYEVLINGHFYCSADSLSEATKEVEAFFEEFQ